MSRRLVLKQVASEQGLCPVPGLLVNNRWASEVGEWWAGVLVEVPARVAAGPGGRLDLTGPGALRYPDDGFHPRPTGELHRVTGTVEGVAVEGVLDQPGARGFVKNLTAFSRDRRKVRVRFTDGREFWVRATGITATTVTTADGRVVGTRTGGPVELDPGAGRLDQLLAVLLITGIDRGSLLAIGTFA